MHYYYGSYRPFEILKGMTMVSVIATRDEVHFESEDGRTFKLYHEQDCCEWVSIDDIAGNLEDLVGTPILIAEEAISADPDFIDPYETDGWRDSYTWTFYKLATVKGYVTIRFYGESNGYYSESVSFIETT